MKNVGEYMSDMIGTLIKPLFNIINFCGYESSFKFTASIF